jgi:hypothetical protein
MYIGGEMNGGEISMNSRSLIKINKQMQQTAKSEYYSRPPAAN